MCKTDTAKPPIGIKCKFSSHWLYNGTDKFCEDCSEKQKLAGELLIKKRHYEMEREFGVFDKKQNTENYKKYDEKLTVMLMNELD